MKLWTPLNSHAVFFMILISLWAILMTRNVHVSISLSLSQRPTVYGPSLTLLKYWYFFINLYTKSSARIGPVFQIIRNCFIVRTLTFDSWFFNLKNDSKRIWFYNSLILPECCRKYISYLAVLNYWFVDSFAKFSIHLCCHFPK